MKSRVFLITGTRKGLGLQLAEHYLSQGHIVVGCSRKEPGIQNSKYRHFNLDVSNEKMVMKMVRSVKKEYGNIDILINNAGIAAMNHFITTPYSNAKKVFDTNFFGTFLFSREVSKVMIRQKYGCIVNYTTVAVPLHLEGEAVYAASKAAIENFTRVTANELAEFGIRVNAIGPTPIYTDLIRNVPEEKINKIIDRQAIKRLGEYKDVQQVVDFLIDEKSDFITGQIIYLGGVF